MKAKLLVLLLSIILYSSINYVHSQIAFGIVSNSDITIKECPFDRSADAVIIYDRAKSFYNDYYNLITERSIKFKILKESGIARGNISIPYYNHDKFEVISDLKAIVNTPDEIGNFVASELNQKNIFNKQINKYYSEITFALPNVKVGSIIEYKFQSLMKNYSGLKCWEFQSEIPIMSSSLELYPLPNSVFAYTVYKKNYLPISIVPNNEKGRIYFEMNNIPGLREEAFITSTKQYLQRVNFQFSSYKSAYGGKNTYINNWKDLAKELINEKDFGNQASRVFEMNNIVGDLANKSAFEKMQLIHQFVKSNISWDYITSKYSEAGIKTILNKKKGNSGDVNLLLISLLRSGGLDAYPLLVSERSNGGVDTTYPYLDQFNKVVAYVKIENSDYVLDGTDYYTPSHMIPFQLLNTTGFIVDKNNYSLIPLVPTQHQQKDFVQTSATITDDGRVKGESVITNVEYAKISKERHYKNDKLNYKESMIKPYKINKLDSFFVKGIDKDSMALTQQLYYQTELKKSGKYLLLNYNLFTEFDKNPFLTEHRFSDIDFGTKYSGIFTSSFELPANLLIESIPESKKLIAPDKSMSITRQVEKTGNKLNILINVNFDKVKYSTNEYLMVKEFYKELIDLLNEPVVFKSK